MIMAESILTVKRWQPENAIAPLIYKRNCKPCIAPCEKKREISMISAPEEASSAVFEYIWIFYGRKRLHEANSCLTPEEYYRIHQTDLKVA